MIEKFRGHRQQFELLRDYALSDFTRGIARVEADSIPTDIIAAHRDAYKRAFDQLDITAIIPYRDKSNGREAVSFQYSSRGLAVSGSLKEYDWDTEAPKVLIGSLDPPFAKEGFVTDTWFDAYRKIDGNWYLHMSAD